MRSSGLSDLDLWIPVGYGNFVIFRVVGGFIYNWAKGPGDLIVRFELGNEGNYWQAEGMLFRPVPQLTTEEDHGHG